MARPEWQVTERLTAIDNELAELTGKRSADARDRRAVLRSERVDVTRELQEGRKLKARLLEASGSNLLDPLGGLIIDRETWTPRANQRADWPEVMTRAHKVIDRANHDGDFSEEAAVNADSLIRRDTSGELASYIATVGSPEYHRAFLKVVSALPGHNPLLTEKEINAVAYASSLRQMDLSAAGYAIPITLDPTLNLTSDGQVNPIRQLARVETITTTEWKGVTSDGVTMAFHAESYEETDGSPTLVQPTIYAEKASGFVPFTIEAGEDWAALTTELVKCFADARDALEAEKFVTGAGHASNEPEGIIAGLDPSSLVASASASTFADDDVYALKQSLAPRFQPNAKFLASGPVLDYIRRMTGPASAEPSILTDGPPVRILGKPAYEVSDMTTLPSTAGETVLLYADLKQFLVLDRVGMSLEIIPHLFGAARHYPIGQRGAYVYFRVGAGILADAAFKATRIKAT
jgi:HK97 family phage major capsid protein